MEDALILDLFFSRNESAIKETHEKYGIKLKYLSMKIIGNESDADECVNDTYLAAWNSIPPTRPNNYYAYICKITRNLSYNKYDMNVAQKRDADVISLTDELSEIISDGSFDDNAENDLSEAISRFIHTLDEDVQMIFVRRYFYADSLDGISKITGLSANGISAKLMRVRKKLKIFLEKEGFAPKQNSSKKADDEIER